VILDLQFKSGGARYEEGGQPTIKAQARCSLSPARDCNVTAFACGSPPCVTLVGMGQVFNPGDDLIFQLESGFGLLRVLAVEERENAGTVWHLLAYEELFPDVETAEAALAQSGSLHVRKAHLALTDRAFERTPAARLGNRPVMEDELAAYRNWVERGGEVSDRSALLMLGLR
jgi:hypothetical protein